MSLSPEAKAHAAREQSQQATLRWLLLHTTADEQPATMVEVGVYCGQTPRTLLPNLPALYYIGVDPYLPWAEKPGYINLAHARQQALKVAADFPLRMRLLEVPSATAATWVGDHSLDLVFIDAGHEREAAEAEIRAWLPKVRAGGIVCGHDLNFQQGVLGAVGAVFGDGNYNYVGGQADVWWVRV